MSYLHLRLRNPSNNHDLTDAFGQLMSSSKLILWCTNKVAAGDKRTRGNVSGSDNETENEQTETANPKRKKQSRMEEMEARRNELVKLRSKHDSAYSVVQYRLWAEMIIAKTHESINEAPNVPMFGGKRSRGR